MKSDASLDGALLNEARDDERKELEATGGARAEVQDDAAEDRQNALVG